MARRGRGVGSVNFIEMVQFEDKIKGLSKGRAKKINEAIVKEQAKAVLGNLVRLTKAGEYNNGMVGGTLRRGWTVDTHQEAFNTKNNSGAAEVGRRVESLKIKAQGKKYTITLRNPVEYALTYGA